MYEGGPHQTFSLLQSTEFLHQQFKNVRGILFPDKILLRILIYKTYKGSILWVQACLRNSYLYLFLIITKSIKKDSESILMNTEFESNDSGGHLLCYTSLNVQFISVIHFGYTVSRKSWFKQTSSLPCNLKILFNQTDPKALGRICRTFLFQS